MNLGNIFFELRGTSGTLEVDAKKEAEAAGFAAGAAFSASFSGKLKASAAGIVGAGLGLEIGKQMLHGLETAFQDVANVIPGMIAQGQAFALNVQDIMVKSGASAETASRFAGTLTYLGQSTEGLGQSLKTLSVQIVSNEAQFTKLGIATRDSGGNLLDTITILGNLRSYLSTTGDGATKLALATHLLGKSAGNLIEFLSLTNEQARFLNTMMDNLAVTMGGDTVAAAVGLRREENLLDLAWQGFSTALLGYVVPALRQVIGGIIELVATHGPELRQMLGDITNTVLGFASALVGVSGVTPFQMQLDALGSSTGNAALSQAQWEQTMGYLPIVIDKVTSSTKAGTSAIDKQIKSIDNQIAASKKRDDADETIFQRTMKRLAGEYGAQLNALDLADKLLAIANRRRDLNEQLNQAKLDLTRAQGGEGGTVDAGAVSSAMANIASIQAQQAENERQIAEDTQRARLQAVQSYIEGVAKLEADNDNKKALANTLARRETKLTSELAVAQAAKDATTVADITAKLEAVKTAEARTARAIRNGDKGSELTALKAQLDAQKAAIGAADSATTSANKAELARRTRDYRAYVEGLRRASELSWEQTGHDVGASIMGDPATGTGIGGAMTKAFTDGQAAGEAWGVTMRSVIASVANALDWILKGLEHLFSDPVLQFLMNNKGLSLRDVLGPDLANVLGVDMPAAGGDRADSQRQTRPLAPGRGGGPVPAGYAAGSKPLGGAKALGGAVMAGVPFIGNEKRQEFFMPDQSGTIIPSVGAVRGLLAGGGGQPAIIRIEIGGKQLVDYIDQHLEYKRRA